jgi:hypothetical protein
VSALIKGGLELATPRRESFIKRRHDAALCCAHAWENYDDRDQTEPGKLYQYCEKCPAVCTRDAAGSIEEYDAGTEDFGS